MYLVSLIYASEVNGNLGPNDIDSILDSAKKNNAKGRVTGALMFNSNYFLQYLEGPRASVNEIYHHIVKDRRHKNIVILDYKEVAEREFKHWSMGYIPDTIITKSDLVQYSVSDQFEPHKMQGESARRLLRKLSLKIPEI